MNKKQSTRKQMENLIYIYAITVLTINGHSSYNKAIELIKKKITSC